MSPLLVTLTGSPHDMGVQHGRQLKDEIHYLAKERYQLAVEHAARHGVKVIRPDCLRLAREHLAHHRRYAPAAYEEFEGIARSAQISLEELLIANALTDFRDVLWQRSPTPAGALACTSFAVRRSQTTAGVSYIGQTWDMHASAERTVHVFHRKPDEGPSSLTVSTAGCLPLLGVNEVGLAVCNNNLQPRDARPGVTYLSIIHEALRQTVFGAAIRAVTEAPRSSGHNYLLADDDGAFVNIETTAEQVEANVLNQPHHVHTNHYLSPRLAARELEQDLRSSRHRLDRLAALFQQSGRIDGPEHLQQLLSDTEGGPELCLCREGTGREPRTCAFAVLSPEQRTMWMTVGPPNRGKLARFALN
jgi:isopenicillin-N N-acyltransferase-like protein